ncbi:MAG: ATP-grasp domain-containing protein [Eubacterium sp.]|nr:ATP-grasp domain-containing protein [Eubacterium sp.]
MDNIMILGAGDFQLPLVQKASEKYNVILVAPSIDSRFDKYVYKKYYFDVREQDKILEIAKQESIVGITTDQTDIPVRTVAYVAENMNLPGIGYEVAKIFTDKGLMRHKLEEAGIDVIPYVCTDNLNDAISFMSNINSSVIVKPVDTQGSRGVIKVDSIDDLSDAFYNAANYSTNNCVVVEKYIVGPEVVIEGITVNYNCVKQICGDTIYFDDKTKFSAKKRIFPSSLNSELVDNALQLNKRIIKAFGLNNGITHGEYIFDGNKVYLIEIAARGGGVFISSDLIHETTGLNTEEFLLDISVGKTPDLALKDTGKTAGYRAFYLQPGIVKKIEGINTICSFPFIKRNQFDCIYEGMQIDKNVNKTSRFAFIIVADSLQQWIDYQTTIKNILSIVNNESMDSAIIWE